MQDNHYLSRQRPIRVQREEVSHREELGYSERGRPLRCNHRPDSMEIGRENLVIIREILARKEGALG